MKALLTNLSVFVFLLLFTSCDPRMVFEKNQRIPGGSWDAAQPAEFEVFIPDTLQPFNLYVNIRNKGSYSFSNLFLFITITSPAGEKLTDTVEFTLADSKGKWYGKGIGDLYFLRAPWKKNIRFPHTGIYQFRFTQGMRTNPLPGITDIGMRIEKVH